MALRKSKPIYLVIAVVCVLVVVGLLSGNIGIIPGSRLDQRVQGAKERVTEVIDNAIDAARSVGNGAPEAIIDWGDGVLRATGRGALPTDAQTLPQAKLMAIGAAEMDAHRQLAATLRGLRLKADIRAQEYMLEQYKVDENISAAVRGARIVEIRPLPDSNVEVVVELRLVRKSAPAEAATHAGGVIAATPASAAGSAPVVTALDYTQTLRTYINPQAAYDRGTLASFTGIVLDARHTAFNRSRDTRVVTVTGEVVLPDSGAGEAGSPFVFSRELADAGDPTQIGDNPLFVRVEAVAGEGQTDLVVNGKDAQYLKALPELGKIMQQQRVMVVY